MPYVDVDVSVFPIDVFIIKNSCNYISYSITEILYNSEFRFRIIFTLFAIRKVNSQTFAGDHNVSKVREESQEFPGRVGDEKTQPRTVEQYP